MEVSEQKLASPSTRTEEQQLRHEAARPERVIGRIGSSDDGPTLVCLGGVHGNEPAGHLGLERVVATLRANGTRLDGEFLALVGNRHAVASGVRFLEEDLNRSWSNARLAELRTGVPPASIEEGEILELASEIEQAMSRATGQVWLLDLHTTSGFGPPFGVLDDTLENREFASMFEIPFVVGLEEELDGTVLSHYVTRGVRTFGLESGQHIEVDAVERAEAAIWIALVGVGLIEPSAVPDFTEAKRRLAAGTAGLPSVVEIRYRHGIRSGDGFVMDPGFISFQRIKVGQRLAHDHGGPILAAEGGRLLMPLYQKQGNDGFFVVRRVSRFWMWLSSVLRRSRAERFVHWLPGVRRVPVGLDSFVVDRRVARWFALELLHLLGFRRHGRSGQYLVVSRRPDAARQEQR